MTKVMKTDNIYEFSVFLLMSFHPNDVVNIVFVCALRLERVFAWRLQDEEIQPK